MKSRWFHIPGFHTNYSEHSKKVTFLELFYDLIYVAAFIQLGNGFSADVSFENLIVFCGMFIPLWLTWTGFTYYSNRYNIDDVPHRLIVFVHMFAIGAMAISGPLATEGKHSLFSISYAIAQLTIALLYLRSYIQTSIGKQYAKYWGSSYLISAIIWGLSSFSKEYYFIYWIVGVIVLLIAPLLSKARELIEKFPLDQEHLSERYSLLTIIVLGESFVKVLTELTGNVSEATVLIQASGTLLITCSLWWLYFDDVAHNEVQDNTFSMITWLFSHIPLHGSIVLLAVGIKKVLTFNTNGGLSYKYGMLLGSALGFAYLATAAIDAVTKRDNSEIRTENRVYIRIIAGILCIILGLVNNSMSGGTFLAFILAICIFQVAFDIMAAPEEYHKEDVEKFATKISAKNKDGKSTASNLVKMAPIKKGVPSELKKDLYFYFIEGSWTKLFITVSFSYFFANLFFASLYVLYPGTIANATEQSFTDAFFFSVQTMTTIGYGSWYPVGLFSNTIATIEVAIGLVGAAFFTGVIFAKIARPYAKILFSETMLVQRRKGERYLRFRMGNMRGNDIVEAHLAMTALIDEFSEEDGHFRKMVELKLQRERSPFFTLTWTADHRIDETSPLFGIDLKNSNLKGIIVTFTGHDSTFSNTVFARHTYAPENIRLNHKFEDILHELPNGRMLVNYDKFHDTYEVNPK